MPQDLSEALHEHLHTPDENEDFFGGLRVQPKDEEAMSVSGLRRARRSASNAADTPVKAVSLIEENGVLRWRDNVWAADVPAELGMGLSRRRRRRRTGFKTSRAQDVKEPDQSLVESKTFTAIKPNRIVEAIGRIDQWLNPAIGDDLRSKIRSLRRRPDGTFELTDSPPGAIDGRTLLLVHGTFSNAKNMLDEFQAEPFGRNFLDAALGGARKYDRVLFFEHATLAVSPVINALELGRIFRDASGQIDIIAHSRGGLVVRWWLEAFGKYLAVHGPVNAVLVGSPINGTSLAAPDKLKSALDLISNIGRVVGTTTEMI
jgi:hypothetical protein